MKKTVPKKQVDRGLKRENNKSRVPDGNKNAFNELMRRAVPEANLQEDETFGKG